MLGLFAGADENITPDQVQAFDAALPVEHEIHTYAGAPHSFFDRRQEQYEDESEDAWERILGFIAKLMTEDRLNVLGTAVRRARARPRRVEADGPRDRRRPAPPRSSAARTRLRRLAAALADVRGDDRTR